ncbi:MAG: TIGR03667 family PPOX class F420-dependent oxidoreductase [Chloroflexota bacterium]|nr:MAG: TIGR03667 family PPOX class F420-dependent oxidoreductase [Chloroflexota bacterium]
MLDLDTKFGRKVKRRLKNEQEIWLTTTDANDIPQPRPVWFWWDGETFLIYSEPDAHKLKHIANNRNVALNFNTAPDDGGVVVFIGTAALAPDTPPSHKHKAYFIKYKQGIKDLNMTPEEFSAKWSVALCVTPQKMRGW